MWTYDWNGWFLRLVNRGKTLDNGKQGTREASFIKPSPLPAFVFSEWDARAVGSFKELPARHNQFAHIIRQVGVGFLGVFLILSSTQGGSHFPLKEAFEFAANNPINVIYNRHSSSLLAIISNWRKQLQPKGIIGSSSASSFKIRYFNVNKRNVVFSASQVMNFEF